jgi:hypothetical protein
MKKVRRRVVVSVLLVVSRPLGVFWMPRVRVGVADGFWRH